MERIGYKAFNKGLTNRSGYQFEVGKIYQAKGSIKWGCQGNGFHFCTNLEDCFRYFDSDGAEIALVRGFGNCLVYDDDYYGYYDMCVCKYIQIMKVLSRKEIIDHCLTLTDDGTKHFLMTFKLTDNELKLFKERYKDDFEILTYIEYYQEKNKEAFVKKLKMKGM